MEWEDSETQCALCLDSAVKPIVTTCRNCSIGICQQCLIRCFESRQTTECPGNNCKSMFTQRDIPHINPSSLFRYPFWLAQNKFATTGRPYTLHLFCCNRFLNSDGSCQTCRKTYCCQCMLSNCAQINRCGSPTFANMSRIAKNCPQCLAYIQKADGCNEMFCANCNCSFNFQNGRFLSTIANHSRQLSVFHEKNVLEFCKPYLLKVYLKAYVRVFYNEDTSRSSDFFRWSFQYEVKRLFENVFRPFEIRIVRANELLMNRPSDTSTMDSIIWTAELFTAVNLTVADQFELLDAFRRFKTEYKSILDFYRVKDSLDFIDRDFGWQDDAEWTYKKFMEKIIDKK